MFEDQIELIINSLYSLFIFKAFSVMNNKIGFYIIESFISSPLGVDPISARNQCKRP